MHVSLYHEALERVQRDPLRLTARDFEVLESFGGPQEAARARAALHRAQLKCLEPPAMVSQTKSATPPPLTVEKLARWVAAGVHRKLEPLREENKVLHTRLQTLEERVHQLQQDLAASREENKALGTLVLAGSSAPQRALDTDRGIKH